DADLARVGWHVIGHCDPPAAGRIGELPRVDFAAGEQRRERAAHAAERSTEREREPAAGPIGVTTSGAKPAQHATSPPLRSAHACSKPTAISTASKISGTAWSSVGIASA